MIVSIPSLRYFNNKWSDVEEFLMSKGNPLFTIHDDVIIDYPNPDIINNLYSADGLLGITNVNIETFTNLKYVGGNLFLRNVPIKSFGSLKHVNSSMDIIGTEISKKYNERQIREMVYVGGNIYK
jgi:hypothetical protein